MQMQLVRLVEYLGDRDKRANVDGRPYRFVENKDFKNRRVLEIQDDHAFRYFTEGINGSQFVVAADLERTRESDKFLEQAKDNLPALKKLLGITATAKRKAKRKAKGK